jgi:hypothetical protein
MHNGQPVTPPSTSPATPAPGYGSGGGSETYNPGTLGLVSKINYCYGNSSVTITLPDGSSQTSYGSYLFPC